jgi:hypothetical protein
LFLRFGQGLTGIGFFVLALGLRLGARGGYCPEHFLRRSSQIARGFTRARRSELLA